MDSNMNCNILVSKLQSRIVDIFNMRKYIDIERCQQPIHTFVSECIKQKKKETKRASKKPKGTVTVKSSKKSNVSRGEQKDHSTEPKDDKELDKQKLEDHDHNIKFISDKADQNFKNTLYNFMDSDHRVESPLPPTHNSNDNISSLSVHQSESKERGERKTIDIDVSRFSSSALHNYQGPWVIVKAKRFTSGDNDQPKILTTVWVILHYSSDIYKSSISIDHVRQYIEFIDYHHIQHVFIASARPLTGQGEIELNAFKAKEKQLGREFDWECFLISDLTTEIERHVLVPKHIILSEKEKQKELKRHKLLFESLIDIETNDPMARLLHIQPGVMVKLVYEGSQYIEFRKSSDSDANTVEMNS